VSFAKKLEELRLNVDRIGSVHGRSSTIEEPQLDDRGAAHALEGLKHLLTR
jgi:hypothetical protein